jgi:hypothetical protein
MMLFTADDFWGSDFAGRDSVLAIGGAASDKSCRAFGYIKDVSVLFVDFHFAGRDPAAGHDFVVIGLKQGAAFGKSSGYFLIINLDDTGGRAVGRRGGANEA